ncbi:hypothetical protein QL185_06760 [Cronobacter malonaticus]|uniref:hypothetical protein n=1 Tax=Cronobacter malonaticus TaxID=413503 RepID=UPI000CFC0087|nr:hypothetical protein [Cronobacter malonaticus]MDI6459250.1 hypothetical protein [Cronobacter malonaticus]HAU5432531.1 hypothetical protein [Cronobacter malonaticus]
MGYEMYEVLKQYLFEIEGFGQVRAEIVKIIKPELNCLYSWRASHIYDGYAPNHGNDFDLAEKELIFYIENFDKASAEPYPYF